MIYFAAFFNLLLSSQASDADKSGPPGLHVRRGVLMRHGKPYFGIGANYNSLFTRLLKDKDDTSSLKNLALLGKAGIPFARFRANGFWPANLRLYLDDRPEFFRRMDLIVRGAEQNEVGLIPSLFWHLATVTNLVGEPPDAIGDPDSKANAYIRRFTQDMVLRYKDSSAIWGWEFGNEANLSADLPEKGRQRRRNEPFDDQADEGSPGVRFTSQQLRTAYITFAQTVRKYDPSRMIDSGTSMPRKAAWHNARRQFRQPDSADQRFEMLRYQNPAPVDVLSVHIYQKSQNLSPYGRETIEGFIAQLALRARQARQPLFIGEFPTRDRQQAKEFLGAIQDARVPLAAFWVFDYPPQANTMSVSFDNERAFVLDLVAEANRALQRVKNPTP